MALLWPYFGLTLALLWPYFGLTLALLWPLCRPPVPVSVDNTSTQNLLVKLKLTHVSPF